MYAAVWGRCKPGHPPSATDAQKKEGDVLWSTYVHKSSGYTKILTGNAARINKAKIDLRKRQHPRRFGKGSSAGAAVTTSKIRIKRRGGNIVKLSEGSMLADDMQMM